MKNIKKVFAFLLAFVGVIILASCGDEDYNFVGQFTDVIVADTTAKVEVEFDESDKINDGSAVPFVKIYDSNNKYVSYVSLTFSNTSKVLATVSIKDLKDNSDYRFDLIVTYDGKDHLLDQYELKTLSSDKENGSIISISTVEDFEKMADNRKSSFKLANDIAFSDDPENPYSLKNLFTEDKPFEGTFDGAGYTISNIKISTSTVNAVGIFGATDGATIKNLNIANVESSFTYGKTGYVGILAGSLLNTTVDNINISDSLFDLKTSTSTTMVGFVAGLSKDSTITNVNIENVDMTLTRARGTTVAGLAVGKVEGKGNEVVEATETESAYSIAIKNVYAKGVITANGYINSTSSDCSVFLGGLIGNVATNPDALVTECASDVEIVYTKETSDSYNKYRLYIGGFAAAAMSGYANITDCVAIADIAAYAGKVVTTDDDIADLRSNNVLVEDKYEDDKAEMVTNNYAYIAGFIGFTNNYVSKIDNCAYVVKDDGILVVAKPSDIIVSSTVAKNTASSDAIGNLYVYSQEVLDIAEIAKTESTIGTGLEFNDTIKSMIENKNTVEDSNGSVTE